MTFAEGDAVVELSQRDNLAMVYPHTPPLGPTELYGDLPIQYRSRWIRLLKLGSLPTELTKSRYSVDLHAGAVKVLRASSSGDAVLDSVP
jgi:hypothetical protein